MDRPLELQNRRVWLQSLDAPNGNFRLLRKPEGTLDESGVAMIRIPAGRYLAGGSKRLNSEDGEPIWGWSAIGEVTIRPEAKSEAVIQRFTGSRISGQIKNVSDLLKNAKADHAEVTVSMTIDDNGRVVEFPFDTALCNEAGEFRLGPVPFGRAVLRVNGVDRPGQNRQFRQQPRLVKHRLTLAKRLEVVDLPPEEPDDPIAAQIAAILDSEQPLGVSWSHTDVQVASLRTLTPKEDVSRELIRLMNDPQTTDNWLHAVIRALGELRPVTADIKTALLNGANNPKLHRRAEMIGKLGDMRADAADLIDAISQFKDSPDVSLRGSALRALGTINKSLPQESPQLTAALIAGLNDPVIFIRKEAVGFLGQQKSETGIAELRQHLRTDPSGPVRALCAWAIYKKTDEVDEPLKVLIELLQSADLNDRFEAAIYLDSFDARAKPAIPALEANTNFQDKPPFSNSRDTKRYQLTSAAQRVLKKLQAADEPVKQGRFEGRVRLKTEKPLPDLEKVELPPGKLLDESLVFSKDGGLANVFVYLWKPKFPIQEPAGDPRKAFALTSSGGRFVPHSALVRVGQPLEFVNADKAQLNFRTMPLKNVAENRLVPPETRLAVPAFNVAENLPIQVSSNMYPWMSAYLFPLDHPFAAVTDADGRFSIDGLPPGEHEFRVWHERVGYLQKKLVVTIKPSEESRIELEYEPSRLKLEAEEVLKWNQRFIETPKMPRPLPRVPQRVPEDKPQKDSPVEAGNGSPAPAQKPTEGLPDSGDDEKREQKNNETTTKGDLRSDEAAGSGDPRRAQAIERAVAFLKSQQIDNGMWREFAPIYDGGVSSLCTLALLQAGVKPDDAVIQKALASLRKIKPDKTYTVALQTMVFCAASPKEDAELIRENVAWLEKTQFAVGRVQGGWSYQAGAVGSGDGSNTRFAVMSLLAAKKAGFDVQAETWQRVSDYYLTTQTAEGGWGYSGPAQASLSMTLAGVAGLASANRYLPQNEQRKAREAALQKSAEYLEKKLPIEGTVPATLYALHCLERAGHVSGLTQFDKLGWTADATKRLLDRQGPNGNWSGTGAGENTELIGTSLALLTLTGRPEPKLVARRLRIEPRDPKGNMQVQTSVIQTSTPPRRRIEFSGGVRIEAIWPDGSKWRIEADQAIIETVTGVNNDLEFSTDSDVLRIVCQGSVKIEGEKGDQLTRLTAENLELDLQNGGGWLNQSQIRP